jgi:hypothetical protein
MDDVERRARFSEEEVRSMVNQVKERTPKGNGRRRRPSRERRWELWVGSVVAALALAATACQSPASGRASELETMALVSATSSSACSGYNPVVDPSNFVSVIDNPYFPLEPGTVWRLRGLVEDGVEQERIRVTEDTKVILGVTTTVVKDVVRVDGQIAEFTFDWYAQDRDGNVWYFGEDTAEYKNGEVVSTGGSWEAGVDGALPGIIMNADPQVTDSYRQECYEGEAEDMYWVVATGGTRKVPAGTFENVVRTLEWTPLEPRIVVEKFHAAGVGLIAERALSGGLEEVELLDVTKP